MYPRLREFYMNSLLPELASPRHPSGQPIREPVPFFSFIMITCHKLLDFQLVKQTKQQRKALCTLLHSASL